MLFCRITWKSKQTMTVNCNVLMFSTFLIIFYELELSNTCSKNNYTVQSSNIYAEIKEEVMIGLLL